MLSRDLQRIMKMRDYCLTIQKTIAKFNASKEIFQSETDYQQSIAFSVLQIGELVSGLTSEYRVATKNQMQWHSIKALRNIIVHDYGSIRIDELWEIVIDEIPTLKAFCNEQLPPEYRQDE